MVLSSTFAFSSMALLVSLMGHRSIPSLQSAVARYWLSLLLSLATIAIARRGALCTASTWIGEPHHRRLLLIRGLWGAGGMSSYFWALSKLSIGDATVLMFVNVPLTALMAAVLIGEPYTLVDGITGILCMAGVVLVAQPAAIFGGEGEVPALAVVVCLFGALTSSLAYVTIRQLGPTADPLVITLAFSAVGSVIAPLLLLMAQVPQPLASGEDIWQMLLVGLLGYLGQLALNRGIQLAPAGPATVMRYTDVIFALAFSTWLFGNPPGLVKLGGVALISSSVGGVLYRQRLKTLAARAATVRAADSEAAPGAEVAGVEEGKGAGLQSTA